MDDSSSIGVVFDMDGVLVDSARPHLQSWQQLAREHGGAVSEEQFAATFGRQNDDIIPTLFGEVSRERLKTLSEGKEEIYRDLIRDNAPVVPGAVELARNLHEAAVALAVGSSGPLANVQLVLEAMGIQDLISAIVSGDDVTRGKPDPQVFLLAGERLGIPPRRCVIIEDAPVGVEAAHAAGAHVVAVLMYHPAEAFPQADLVVARLSDLTVDQLVLLARASPPGL